MTHVFVVNERTFNIHLQYLFAGTGYSVYEPSITSISQEKYYAENTFTGMIADISKVRSGDNVLFYVTGCKKFFGVFEIDGAPFFETKKTNYLGDALNKYLPFRVRIKPKRVYSKGILEQVALDDISQIEKPYEMCWSMIYRKLTGMRGCSFVTDYEMNRMVNLLDAENCSSYLTGDSFCYDSDNKTIAIDSVAHSYQGLTNSSLSINQRLYHVSGSHEGHLQAFLMQNYDILPALKSKLFPQKVLKIWIGNEVVCSVGKRRIDVLTISETPDKIQIRIIELKDEFLSKTVITQQLPWYIKWVDEYLAPNLTEEKPIEIVPTLIAYPYKRNTVKKQEFENALTTFNKNANTVCINATLCSIECIFFDRTQFPIKIY